MQLTTQFLPQYLTDAEGNRIAVVLDLQAYHQMIEQIEELEELQAYDMAIADDDDDIPFETAILEIEGQKV
ncbi:MAG: hypothetical protein GC158_15745 [Cyanobacteria bacterium RI_101]|nr:hypothetical protein [Cyanobacteria bacterium RI_101]